MLAPNELTRDPRARRAAAAAVAAGHEVVGVCGSSPGETPVMLKGVEIVRVRSGRVSARLRQAGFGGARRSSALVRELRGLFRIGRLLAANLSLAGAARRVGAADVVHAHDFDALPAGWAVARRIGARLVYDAHEIYADQEPGAPRIYRGLVRVLEGRLARSADAVLTVSEPIAAELRRTLRLRKPPIVVLSCPPLTEVDPAPVGEGPLRAIYQGAMGPGRPLEDLLVAAARAPEVELTLRIAGADLDALREAASALPNVQVAEPVAPDRLVEALAGFHVGLVINRPLTRNDELVFPNKLFEYLMAGLAVLVPRLPGLAPLVEEEQIGLTYEPGRPEDLGDALTRLARDPARLEELRGRARRLAVERFNTEAQRAALETGWRPA